MKPEDETTCTGERDTSRPSARERNGEASPPETFEVRDRRHWTRPAGEDDEDENVSSETERRPTVVDEYRQRAEAAEQKLRDYIEAFKNHEKEQDEFRARLTRDVDRRVDLKFGGLVTDLLEALDDLERGLAHAQETPGAEPFVEGIAMARDRFLAALERNGVAPIRPDGETFDPNDAEAVHVEGVGSPERDGTVLETVRPGYRLGERVIRPARVIVGRHVPGGPAPQ